MPQTLFLKNVLLCVFLRMCVCVDVCVDVSALSACTPLYQKRAPDPTIDGCKLLCSCWGLNPGPLEE